MKNKDQMQHMIAMMSKKKGEEINFINNDNQMNVDRKCRIVTVTSGKGGVGKTNFSVNFGITLRKLGYRVLVIDADFGFSNVDVLVGQLPQYNLGHVISKQKNIMEVITRGPLDVKFISGGSGVADLLNMDELSLDSLLKSLSILESFFDVIIFDTAPGTSKLSRDIVEASTDLVIITSTEPTSVVDTYSLFKALKGVNCGKNLNVIVNSVDSYDAALVEYEKLSQAASRFLDLKISLLGCISKDINVSNAVRLQSPFVVSYPKTKATADIENIGLQFLNIENEGFQESGFKRILKKLSR